MKIKKNSSGFSILEAIIGLFIGSLIMSAAFKANNYFTKGVIRENTKSIIQQEILNISTFITRDIRMAGLSLPGNGIRVTPSDTSNDQIRIFINNAGRQTTLISVLQYSDSIVNVTSSEGMHSKGWICIADAADTVYKKIDRIGVNSAGPDTVYLTTKLLTGPFTLTSVVYPASRIEYFSKPDTFGLFRSMNDNTVCLAPHLDVLSITPKNASGTVESGEGRSAAVLLITIGKILPSGSNEPIIADSTEVNIRNRG